MSQERIFQLQLKNDQTIELKFTPIAATGDRLWQMFATTEALDVVDQLLAENKPVETKSVVKTRPITNTAPAVEKKKK
jgi:hypothetical protein